MSIGRAIYPIDAKDAESLIETADRVLYKAKNDGEHRMITYAPEAEAPMAMAGNF